MSEHTDYCDFYIAPILQKPTRVYAQLPGRGHEVGDKLMFVRITGGLCSAVLVIQRGDHAEAIDWRLNLEEHSIEKWRKDILGPSEIEWVGREQLQ